MKSKDQTSPADGQDTLRMTSDIVASFVSNNAVPSDKLPDVIRSIHKTIANLSYPVQQSAPTRPKPAVPISKSVTDEYLICLEDGRKLKMLKRYLRTKYNMTPEAYRKRWNLPFDYPMVAPNYAKRRSEFAKQFGLGKDSGRRKQPAR